MGDTAKRFSSLLTVICRTAKRSANKVAKIRKKKNGGDSDLPTNVSNTDAVVASPCKTRVSKSSSSSEDHKGMALKKSCCKHLFHSSQKLHFNKRFIFITHSRTTFQRDIWIAPYPRTGRVCHGVFWYKSERSSPGKNFLSFCSSFIISFTAHPCLAGKTRNNSLQLWWLE